MYPPLNVRSIFDLKLRENIFKFYPENRNLFGKQGTIFLKRNVAKISAANTMISGHDPSCALYWSIFFIFYSLLLLSFDYLISIGNLGMNWNCCACSDYATIAIAPIALCPVPAKDPDESIQATLYKPVLTSMISPFDFSCCNAFLASFDSIFISWALAIISLE